MFTKKLSPYPKLPAILVSEPDFLITFLQVNDSNVSIKTEQK